MTPIRQLLRQPVRLIAILLFLSMASTFFCLGAGTYASALATQRELEERFVTIGVPTPETEEVTYELQDGRTIQSTQSVIHYDMWEYLDALAAEGSIIKDACRQQFISACSPALQPVTSTSFEKEYLPILDAPYTRGIFVVRVTEIEEILQFPGVDTCSATVQGTIEKTLALHPELTAREKISMVINTGSAEKLDALDLKPGKRYLIYATDLQDQDLDLRTTLAFFSKCPLEEIDLSRIDYDIENDPAYQAIMKNPQTKPEERPVAKYTHENGNGVFLTQMDLNHIGRLSCSVNDEAGLWKLLPVVDVNGKELEENFSDRYLNAWMTLLEGDADSFLASKDGEVWREAIQEVEINAHAVPVFGTDHLEAIYTFHQGDCFVTQGRSFTEQEYRQGAKVCVISEAAAQAAGLSVGDQIPLSFYWGANPQEVYDPAWKLGAQPYSEKVGFLGEAERYEIVGIYRQSNLWALEETYHFLPNTVFVPNASLPEPGYSKREGVFFSYILQNGKVEALKEALREQGYPESILICFDSGYTELSEALRGFRSGASKLFLVSCVVGLGSIFVYLVLFVRRQRRTVGLMRSLGADRGRTRRFCWQYSMLPVLLAAGIGAVAGILLLKGTINRILASNAELLDTAFSASTTFGHASAADRVITMPAAVLAAAAAQALIYGLAILLFAASMARKPPLRLIREKQ